MVDKIEDIFDPIIELDKQRFDIWKTLINHKKDDDLLVKFKSTEGEEYACIEFNKLLDLLYNTDII